MRDSKITDLPNNILISKLNSILINDREGGGVTFISGKQTRWTKRELI